MRMQSKSALKGRMINKFVESWCLVALRRLEIESLTTSKVLPLFDFTEHKAVTCLELPR